MLFQIPQRYRFSSKSQLKLIIPTLQVVVLDTTKVQIFKQITTVLDLFAQGVMLFQIPQRYRFSSKSQPDSALISSNTVVLDTTKVQIFKQITTRFRFNLFKYCCFRYHKGTDFQANHNMCSLIGAKGDVVLDTTKVQIFKQITTYSPFLSRGFSCFRYHKGTDFQANHNKYDLLELYIPLFQIPQRYRFSSKSQH